MSGHNFMADIRAMPPDASLQGSNRRGSMGPPMMGRRLVAAGTAGNSNHISNHIGAGPNSGAPPAGLGARLGSGAGVGGGPGTGIVAPTSHALVETTENSRPIKINVSNISELQALLDRDADCIVNIRRDIVVAQERELDRAREALVKLKKLHDVARIGNKQKEHQLSTLNDKLRVVESFYETHKDTISAHQVILDELERKIAVVDENLTADRRTRKVLQLMSSRLEVEIERVKMRSLQVSQAMNLKRTELHGHEGAVRSHRQELRDEERKLAELMKLSKSRAAQRATRLAQLQSLALAEAMRSPKKTTNTQDDFEEEIGAEYFRDIVRNMNINNANNSNIAGSKNASNTSGAAASAPVVRPSNSRGSTADTSESRVDGSTESSGTELTTSQLFEATELYANRAARIEKLEALQMEFRDKINAQRQRKIALEEMLEKTLRDRESLTSSRQLFHEVDAKDSALSMARRKYQQIYQKDERLRESLESLRRFVPRVLTKITRLNQPMPNMDQMPDALHKVEDEVSRLIKMIGEILLRDATPEDLAAVTEVTGVSDLGKDERSESSRLHKLPGFARLQRQLFINMMTAVPDGSSRNVRVPSEDKRLMYNSDAQNIQGATDRPTLGMESTYSHLSNGTDSSLDRRTVKEISKLVLSRDSVKGGKGPGRPRPQLTAK